MDFERGGRFNGSGRERFDDGRAGSNRLCQEQEYHPRIELTRRLPAPGEIKSRRYEAWKADEKLSFQECVTPPLGGGLKPGIDDEKVKGLPANHPARIGYTPLDVLCAWIDRDGREHPENYGGN